MLAAQVRKQAVRQPRKVLQALEAPAEVAATQERKKEPAIKNMEDMHAALLARPGHAANVLACVVNHASFGQSVENAFALSFLVCYADCAATAMSRSPPASRRRIELACISSIRSAGLLCRTRGACACLGFLCWKICRIKRNTVMMLCCAPRAGEEQQGGAQQGPRRRLPGEHSSMQASPHVH